MDRLCNAVSPLEGLWRTSERRDVCAACLIMASGKCTYNSKHFTFCSLSLNLSSRNSWWRKGETRCLEMSPGVSVWLIYTQMWFFITIYDHFPAGLSLSQLWNSLLLRLLYTLNECKFWRFLKGCQIKCCVQTAAEPHWLEVSLSAPKWVTVKEMMLEIYHEWTPNTEVTHTCTGGRWWFRHGCATSFFKADHFFHFAQKVADPCVFRELKVLGVSVADIYIHSKNAEDIRGLHPSV